MNEPLIDEEPVTLQIGEYVLKIEDEITSVEIETFLKKVKNGKASGPDDIPYEFYKHSGESFIEMLRSLFDEMLLRLVVATLRYILTVIRLPLLDFVFRLRRSSYQKNVL
ncbi:hypothetical protein FHG87_012445 [Trinorchestia longiramus]|nr:hypothetical protein FHG87_012445 [Trinorchestia longiramus]